MIVEQDELARALAGPSLAPWLAVAAALLGAVVLWWAALESGTAASRTLAQLVAICLGLGAGFGTYFAYRSHVVRARRRSFELEQRIVGLAYQREGILTVFEAAEALRLKSAETDQLLTELAKVGRATLEVSQEGRMRYVFRDAKPTRGIRVRGRDASGQQPISRNKRS